MAELLELENRLTRLVQRQRPARLRFIDHAAGGLRIGHSGHGGGRAFMIRTAPARPEAEQTEGELNSAAKLPPSEPNYDPTSNLSIPEY